MKDYHFHQCVTTSSKIVQNRSQYHAFFQVYIELTDKTHLIGAAREKIIDKTTYDGVQKILSRYPNSTKILCYAPSSSITR